jgi:alginate O-acetyltransferase complex protein AlgI
MLFNTLEFLVLFLPLVLVVALRVRGNVLLFWLCLASTVFYGFAGHAWFLVPMAVTTVLDFWVGRRLESAHGASRRRYLLLSLCGNLGLLAYFKYSGLFAQSARDIANVLHLAGAHGTALEATLRVTLPAGISFYTFQTLSYVLDIYRGHAKPEKNFFAYLAFVSFFPHLVAGPLTRHNQLIPQLYEAAERRVRPRWWAGMSLFSIGLCKKVLVADRIANWNDPLIDHVGSAGLFGAWVAVLGYAMQIYFDFSGYSDMAIGLGRLFSVELPQNFDSPYKATSPADFWRRWHITLSQWLRDYLYISLGGNRCSPARRDFNLLMTMTLGGLWHGASWTFAVWGLFHGACLIAYHKTQRNWDDWHPFIKRALTFLLVCIGWVFFRARTMRQAGAWLAGMAGLHGISGSARATTLLSLLIVVCLIICNLAKNAYERELDLLGKPARALLGIGTAASVILMNYASKFLYFQF